MTKSTNYRLTDEDKAILELLSQHHGISETDVIRMLIRKSARDDGLIQSRPGDISPMREPYKNLRAPEPKRG